MPKGDGPHLKERYAADSLTPYGVGPWHTRGAVVGPCTMTVSSGHVKLQALALILMTVMATRTPHIHTRKPICQISIHGGEKLPDTQSKDADGLVVTGTMMHATCS